MQSPTPVAKSLGKQVLNVLLWTGLASSLAALLFFWRFNVEVSNAAELSARDVALFKELSAPFEDTQAWPRCDALQANYQRFLAESQTKMAVVLARSLRENAIGLGCGSPQLEPEELARWSAIYEARDDQFSWVTKGPLSLFGMGRVHETGRRQIAAQLHASWMCEHDKAIRAKQAGSSAPGDAAHEAAGPPCDGRTFPITSRS